MKLLIKTKISLLVMVLLILFAAVPGFWLLKDDALRVKTIQNQYVQFFLPTYRSLRKIVDLPYIIYKIRSDDLPVYSIFIQPEDIILMNAALPADIAKGRLTDKNKIKVGADFYAKGYQDRIKIRYRGRGPNHWNAFKKSLHIDFPDENPLPGGFTELKLYIPEDRGYGIEPLNMYRAKKLGLPAPQPWFIKVSLNEQEPGVYMAISHWSKEWLETNQRPETSNIFGIIDLTLNELKDKNFYDPKSIAFWKDYTKNADTNESDYNALREFLTAIHEMPDPVFKKALPVLVDMDSLYSWLILNTLASSTHQNAKVNIILLRDPSTGKFQPIPWDTQIYDYHPLDSSVHPLIGRMLAIPEYRDEFLSRLKMYVLDASNLEDDLDFYDATIKRIKTALMKDDAKFPLDFQVNSALRKYRKMVKNNFTTISSAFKNGDEAGLIKGGYKFSPSGEDTVFSPFLSAAIENIDGFIRKNPRFYKIDNNTVGIGPGTYSIPKTVYIPASANLTIKPNTTLYLGENASIIVFSRVTARGTKQKPIKLLKASQKPWGSLLILGSGKQTSEFRSVQLSGGSGFHKFGINATGMIAIHNGNAIVQNSVFENSADDDALNIKHGNVSVTGNFFRNTFSDAIDIDSGAGEISGNRFENIGRSSGGDAIDISFSKIAINKNTINGCSDKGISVGEKSQPMIEENLILHCAIGISVKDLSEAQVKKVYLIENEIGFEVKRKKPIFGGGNASLEKSLLAGNEQDFRADEYSTLNESQNTIIGRDSFSEKDIKKLIPADLQ